MSGWTPTHQNLFFSLSVSAILDSMVPNQWVLDTRWLLAQNLVSILCRAGTADPAKNARKVLLGFESARDGDIKNPHLGLAQHLLCTLYPLRRTNWCGVSPVDFRNIREK